jgi:uncharacterized protein YggU (UPF0235/DUF167 family)
LKNAKPRAERRGEAAAAPAATLEIRVIPRSPRSRVDGTRGGAILVRLAAPPVDGAANAALIALLSDALDIPRARIAVVAGTTARDKRVRIDGLDADAARARLLR